MQTRYLRAFIAIGTISAIAGASFFVANRLSSGQSVAPNSPDSKPFALTTTIRNNIRLPDEDIRDIQRTTTGGTSSNPKVEKPIPKDERDDPIPKPTAYVGFQTPQNTGGGSGGVNPTTTPFKTPNQPTTRPDNEPTPNKPVPTPTFVSGTFGYQATAEQRNNQNSYMSDASNNCTDGQGFISGTGCFNGQRRVLGLPDTQRAYQQALIKAQDEIVKKSDEELLQLSGKNCPPTDNTCRETAIADVTSQLLKANAVVLVEDKKKISDTRTVNQATQDILFATDEQFKIKYGTENRQTGFEKLLAKLGVTKESLGIEVDTSKLVASREVIAKYSDPNISLGTLRTEYCKTTNDPTCPQDFKREDILNNLQLPTEFKDSLIGAYKEEATKGQKITDQTLAFLSNKSDQELAKEFCANSGNKTACERSFKREDLLANNPNPQEIIQIKKDQSLAQIYADPRNSTSDLAKIYCKGNRGCEENFTPDRFLSQISSQITKQDAVNNRNIALSLFIPDVVTGKPVTGIDVETKKEIVKLNEDTTYAFWVYVRENSARQHKQNITTEQLALEFSELVKQNPSILTENLKKYNDEPKRYTMSFTTFKFDKEENPLIIAQYNQIIKTQPIKGLFENNKVVAWNQVSEEYKQEAREIACKNDKSLAIYCNLVNPDSYASKTMTKEQRETALAQIDAAMANNNTQNTYLQQIYNSRTTDNLLSVNQSNLATVDNPALGDPTLQAEIKKAQNTADVAEIKNQMTYNTITYGDGMGMAPIIVPTTYKGENTKLTDEEKANIANEFLRRQVVVETYTRGAGVGGALATAGVATTACAAFGPGGVLASPICGAVAGLAGVVSNIVPILGTATAEEIEAERQFWVERTGSEQAGSFIQAMYSNQGAASDESWYGGRSQSNLDNQYALLDRIHQTNYQTGATTNTLIDPVYQAQIAILPYQLQQGELLQEANQQQQILNIASSVVVGGISGGVGGNLAARTLNSGTTGVVNNLVRSTANDLALWAGGALINDLQTSYQFDSTVNFLDTQTEINLEICNRTQGSNATECLELAQKVKDENQDAKNQTRQQAFVTDAIIQVGQTSFSAAATAYNALRPSNQGPEPLPLPDPHQGQNGIYHDGEFIPMDIVTENITKSRPELTANVGQTQPEFTATPIDSKTEAIKSFIAEAASPARTNQMSSSEIREHLNNSGYSPEDVDFVLERVNAPEIVRGIEELRVFNTETARAFSSENNADTQAAINDIRQSLLNSLAKNITQDPNTSTNTSANTTTSTPDTPNNQSASSATNNLNRFENDTRVVSGNVVGGADTAETQIVRYAQDIGIDIQNKQIGQIVSEIKAKQNQARTIPPEATIKEVDKDGNIKYSVEGLEGVTFIADKNSPEATTIKNQNTTDFVGKKASDISIDIPPKSPIDELNNNRSIPNNLKTEITSQYQPDQIADFNNKLNDPNYRPSNDPATSARRLLEQTPEDKLLNLADKYGYDTDRPLTEILTDVRTTENQISNTKNPTPLSPQQRAKSTLAIPRRLAAKLLEIQKLFPGAKTAVVDLYGGRVWSGNYLEGTKAWSDFTNAVNNLSIDPATKKAIIDSSREHLTDYIKSSILANNPDLIHSPKGPYEDIFTDINPDEMNSLGLMKKYFEKGGAFEKDFQTAVTELNNAIENGGTIKRIQIDKNWKIPKFETENLSASNVLLMGLSLEFNPDLPTKFHFLDNEVYSAVQGKDGQILNAALASELKAPGYVELVAENFPVIRQTEINDPNKSERYIVRKNTTIRGKALDPNPIPAVDKPTSTRAIFGDQDLTPEQINFLAQFNHETGTSVESLIASLSPSQREQVLNNTMTELEIRGVTDIEFNNTTQVARDIAGLSIGTDAVNEHISTPDGNKERFVVLDGWATFKSIMMESFDVEMKKIGSFITHERAGDGALNTSVVKLTSENIGQIIELSNLYKTNIDKALNGDFGPNVKRTAEILVERLGDNVYLKVGISEGDTYATIHTNENGITVEFKSTSNVNEYMDNVKKYLTQQKKDGNYIPEKIISVSENIYKDFDLAGYTKFASDIEGRTAYFIIKNPEATNTTTPPQTRPNNSFKRLLIDTISSMTQPLKPRNDIKTTLANILSRFQGKSLRINFDDALEVATYFSRNYDRNNPSFVKLSGGDIIDYAFTFEYKGEQYVVKYISPSDEYQTYQRKITNGENTIISENAADLLVPTTFIEVPDKGGYAVQKFINGKTLTEPLDNSGTVSYLKGRGLYIDDLPGNIIINQDGKPMMIDVEEVGSINDLIRSAISNPDLLNDPYYRSHINEDDIANYQTNNRQEDTPVSPHINPINENVSRAVDDYIKANFASEVIDPIKKAIFGSGETTVKPQVNPINRNISKAVDDYIKANFRNMTQEEYTKFSTKTKQTIKKIIERYKQSRKAKTTQTTETKTKKTPRIRAKNVIAFLTFSGTAGTLANIFSNAPQPGQITPTPTAIYASPTPTTTGALSPTTTLQPTITIVPTTITPTPLQPKTFTPYTLPEIKSMTTNNMTEFAQTAKAIGEMVISCQSRGIYKDQAFYDCLCEQTANACATNSTEKIIITSLTQSAGGQKPLECVEFLFEIERVRSNPIASGCQASRANDMTPDKCEGAGKMGAYYCPKEVIEKNGFVAGDVIVWQDENVGHTEVCTETNGAGCNALGANANKDGLVQFRQVDNNAGYAGVWRGGSNIEGCTEY